MSGVRPPVAPQANHGSTSAVARGRNCPRPEPGPALPGCNAPRDSRNRNCTRTHSPAHPRNPRFLADRPALWRRSTGGRLRGVGGRRDPDLGCGACGSAANVEECGDRIGASAVAAASGTARGLQCSGARGQCPMPRRHATAPRPYSAFPSEYNAGSRQNAGAGATGAVAPRGRLNTEARAGPPRPSRPA